MSGLQHRGSDTGDKYSRAPHHAKMDVDYVTFANHTAGDMITNDQIPIKYAKSDPSQVIVEGNGKTVVVGIGVGLSLFVVGLLGVVALLFIDF